MGKSKKSIVYQLVLRQRKDFYSLLYVDNNQENIYDDNMCTDDNLDKWFAIWKVLKASNEATSYKNVTLFYFQCLVEDFF